MRDAVGVGSASGLFDGLQAKFTRNDRLQSALPERCTASERSRNRHALRGSMHRVHLPLATAPETASINPVFTAT